MSEIEQYTTGDAKWFPLKSENGNSGEIKLGFQLIGMCYSVADYALASDQNSRWRKKMEDTHILIDKFGDSKDQGYFAIYDGHGGTMVSELLTTTLHPVSDELF